VKRPWWFNEGLQSFTPMRFVPPELVAYQGRALVFDADVFLRVSFLLACFPHLTGSVIAQIAKGCLERSACQPDAASRLENPCLTGGWSRFNRYSVCRCIFGDLTQVKECEISHELQPASFPAVHWYIRIYWFLVP
jgi:hypothetical protein